MTTIAFDGKFLAADSLTSCGNRIYGYREKIVRVKGGLLASAGNIEDIKLVIDWFNEGQMSGNKPSLEEFQAIFIPDQGLPLEYCEKLAPTYISTPWVCGSGGDFALAAMKLGKPAHEAVELACSIDLHSGGDVFSLQVRE